MWIQASKQEEQKSQRPPARPEATVHLQPAPELAPNVPCYQNESAELIN